MVELNAKEQCKWCAPHGETLANNASHFIVDKPHADNPGVIIVVKRHIQSPGDMTSEEWADLREMLRHAQNHLEQFKPNGFTIGWNVGETAGQHVFHVHMHMICRFDHETQAGLGLRDLILR